MEELPFFVYDHEALVEEGDDLIDAIMFYHPKATPLNSQCALCGQLMGMVRCLEVISGAAPSVYHLQKYKIAVRHTGRFTLALGASADLPNAAVLKQMDSLYRIFAFYHGSLDAVFKRCGGEKQPFLLAMERIWECYLPYIKHYSRVVPAMFDVIPSVPLPKSAGVLFLRASHILQSCQRKPGVLAGCLLYDNKVLCTQLSPELTSRLLLIKANQSNHPANEVETDFSLPFGVRILSVYLTKKESRSLSNHSQKLFPTRQRHTAVSSFQSPGGGGRRVNRTASEESARSLSLRGVGDGRESDGQISREQSFITPPFRLTDSFIDKEDKQSSTTSNESLVETLSTETVLSADKGTDSALSGPLQADGGTSSASSRRDSSQSGTSVKSGGNIGALESYEGEISMSSTELADEREHGGIDEDSSVLVMKVEDHDLPVAQLGNSRSNDAQVKSPDVQLPKVLPTEEIQSSKSSKNVLSDTEHGRANSTEESEQPPVSEERTESIGLEKASNSVKGNTEKMSASESGHVASKEDKPQELLPDQPHPTLDDVSNTGAQEPDATSGKPTGVCNEESDSLKTSVLEDSNQVDSNQKSQKYNDHSNGGTDATPKLEKCNLTDSNEVPDDIVPIDENGDDSKRTVVVSEPVLLQNAGSFEHTDTAKTVENTSEDLHESEELCMEGLDDVSRLKHAVSSQHTDANASQSSKSTNGRICNGRLETSGIASQKTLTETANTTATSNDEAASELRETEVTPTLPELTPENQNGGAVMEQAASEVIGSSEFNDPSVVDSLNTSHTSVPKSSISDQQLTSTVTVEDDLQEGCQDASDTLEGEDKDAEDLRRKKTSCADSKLPGLVNAGLYIQGHSHMVLLMLIERNCQNDLPTMQGLWKTSVTQMGDLEGQLKEVVFPTNSGAAEEGYNFLHFDGFDRLLKGNLQEPVFDPDVLFCNNIR
ncbi:uncharacterized protein LOC144875183 isoform X2 [Branchiostoma floridae x Branchiostoma japonicum]